MKLKNVPKRILGLQNTPIQKLDNVSKDMGVNLYIKRDDLNGLGLGGNKIRKLCYLVEDAMRKDCNVLLTYGGVQTNHGRLTAAVAAKLGLKCCIIMSGPVPEKATGNIILDKMLKADLVFMDDSVFKNDKDYTEKMDKLCEKTTKDIIGSYEKNGDKVYSIPVGGSSPLGALGYVDAITEINQQLEEMDVNIDYIVSAYGSIGTYGGLVVGNKMQGSKYKVIGMNVLHDFKSKPELINEHLFYMNEICKNFEIDISIDKSDIWVERETIRKGYNIPDKLTQDRVLYLASKEAVFLDYCYTGKAFSGLVDIVENDKIPKGANVLFIHTGGIPGVFSDIHMDAMQERIWSEEQKVYTL